MPGTPKPVGSNAGLPPIWNAVMQAISHTQSQTAGLGATSAKQASLALEATENTGAAFTPASANDWETPASGGAPSVTAQIGVSGQCLLLASATVTIAANGGVNQRALVAYSYQPQGGTQTGPSTSTQILAFGSITSGWSGASSLTMTSAGMATLSGLPSGPVTFSLAYQSASSQGASFQNMTLAAWPL